jgi:hypothetical protein
MALSVSFTAESVAGVESDILFTDTSSGSDGTIVTRRIYVSTDTGEFLVEAGTTTDYELWDFADSSIQLNLLSKDYAVKITVEWRNGADEFVYDYTIDGIGFKEYNENFSYQLTQLLAGNPLLFNDNNYKNNKSDLRDAINSGDQALLQATSLYNAQRCYDIGTELRLKSQYFFNQNS